MKKNSPFQDIIDSGKFDIGELIKAGNIQFILAMKEADSFHLFIDQISQLDINISDLPRPRSPFKIKTDLMTNEPTEPIIVLQNSHMQYAIKASFLSAFAALENFLLVTNICFEVVELTANNKITDHQLLNAARNAIHKTHKNQSIDKIIHKLGSQYLHPDVLDLFKNLKNLRNCIAHRWGKVSTKDVNLDKEKKLLVKYFDLDIPEIENLVIKKNQPPNLLYKSPIKETLFEIDEMIIFSSSDCQKLIMTLMKIQSAFSHATFQWVVDQNIPQKASNYAHN